MRLDELGKGAATFRGLVSDSATTALLMDVRTWIGLWSLRLTWCALPRQVLKIGLISGIAFAWCFRNLTYCFCYMFAYICVHSS